MSRQSGWLPYVYLYLNCCLWNAGLPVISSARNSAQAHKLLTSMDFYFYSFLYFNWDNLDLVHVLLADPIMTRIITSMDAKMLGDILWISYSDNNMIATEAKCAWHALVLSSGNRLCECSKVLWIWFLGSVILCSAMVATKAVFTANSSIKWWKLTLW